MAKLLGPKTTLAVLIGASDWSASRLPRSPSFRRSASALQGWLIRGLGLEPDRIVNLFDSQVSATDQLGNLSDSLQEIVEHCLDEGIQIEDALIFYIGHGILDGSSSLTLLVRKSRQGMEDQTGIRVSDLARVLKVSLPQQRHFVVLDCCFSGAAASTLISMGARDRAIAASAKKDFSSNVPRRGGLLLCACSADEVAIGAPEGPATLFSGALLDLLKYGDAQLPDEFSFFDLKEAIADRLLESLGTGAPRPVLHSVNQKAVDLSRVPAFSNPFAVHLEKARQDAAELALREQKKREAAEQAEKERKQSEDTKRERVAAEAAVRIAQETAFRETAERAARERAERVAAEKAEREKREHEAHERSVRERAERDAAAQAAQEKAYREAVEKAARERAKRPGVERGARGNKGTGPHPQSKRKDRADNGAPPRGEGVWTQRLWLGTYSALKIFRRNPVISALIGGGIIAILIATYSYIFDREPADRLADTFGITTTDRGDPSYSNSPSITAELERKGKRDPLRYEVSRSGWTRLESGAYAKIKSRGIGPLERDKTYTLAIKVTNNRTHASLDSYCRYRKPALFPEDGGTQLADQLGVGAWVLVAIPDSRGWPRVWEVSGYKLQPKESLLVQMHVLSDQQCPFKNQP